MCNGSIHNLKVIYVDGASDHDRVVRWCRDCGAVAVDVDVDRRTQPGGFMKMQFPSGKREPRS